MCGINGIVKFNGDEIEREEILSMNKKIKHRGPDDDGLYVDRNVGFGHVRLSILDLSERGHQPMVYEKDGRHAVITFNGEIYNFQEIKSELEARQYVFKSTSDTEVILAAYLEWGEECVKKFNGMFAFVIYDPEKNILFGARDRLGKKPLKYYFGGDKFIFSSELKAILTQKVPREMDLEAINYFLTLQYVPAPRTGFKSINKLPHASLFTLNLKTKKFKVEKYWDLDYSEKFRIPETEIVSILENKLEESVKKRLIADVEVGAFLSGGVDSSAIVAFAARQKQRLKTFTIKFSEERFDESRYAKIVADRYKTDHYEFLVEAKDALNHIENLVEQYEEPYADASQLPTFILAKETSKYVKVALNGDGGDENFGGYDKYQVHLLFRILKYFPLRDRLADIMAAINKGNKSVLLHKLVSLLKNVNLPDFARHFNLTNYFDVFLKKDFYKKEYWDYFENSQYSSFKDVAGKLSRRGLDNIFYLDFNTYVPDDLMVKVDIATMANGLESRSPLLDYEFVQMCAKIEDKDKLDIFGARKKIFKRMLRKYLSKEVLYRRKKGFSLPIKHWFRNELKGYARDLIFDQSGPALQLMKKEKVSEMFAGHQAGQDHSKRLWMLMVLNLWHKKFFG